MPAIKTRRMVTAGNLEWRSDSEQLTLEGYASTFDQPYDMGWYEESVRMGAFSKTLSERPDVRLLINHDGLPLARTRSNTLELSQDSSGLHVRANLDPNDPDVQRLAPKMERGDLDEMSFGFRAIRQEWNDDYTKRELTELSLDGGDVSVVTYPANPSTSVSLRMQALVAEDPAKVRDLYRQIVEDETETRKAVAAALESLGAIEDEETFTTISNLLRSDDAQVEVPEESPQITHPLKRARLRAALGINNIK